MPALRERVADLELLAQHFTNIFALKMNKKAMTIHADFITALQQHHWNGNIRELKNVIERAVILANGNQLSLEDLPVEIQLKSVATTGKQLSAFSLQSAEKLHIQKVLNHTKGNKAESARLLEIGIATLYRKIEEYKL